MINNEAPVLIHSVQVTQNNMEENEDKTILQSLNRKQQEFL